jgi:hypothetical protein
MDLKSAKKARKEKADLEDFILITEKNRRNAIKYGTIIYLIENKIIKHRIIVRPRLIKGKTLVADGDPHFKELNVVNGETEAEYIDNFEPLLNKVIGDKNAYIKKGDKLVTYYYK